MSEKRKKLLEELADSMSKMSDVELEKMQIFSVGIAAGVSVSMNETKPDTKEVTKNESEKT